MSKMLWIAFIVSSFLYRIAVWLHISCNRRSVKKEASDNRKDTGVFYDNYLPRTMMVRLTDPHMSSDIDVWASKNMYNFIVPTGMLKVETVTYKRSEQSKLTPDQRDRFITAIKSIISAGLYGPLVGIHSNHEYHMHGDTPVGGLRFLPWHRVYLYQLEYTLQKLDPEVTIPYWDWTKNREFPKWLGDFKPHVIAPDFSSGGGGKDRPIDVVRDVGRHGSLPTDKQISSLDSISDYRMFEQNLEIFHGGPHNWVGGTMAYIPTAPADPVFWLHHANIDRIWNNWQKTHSGKDPPLRGRDAVMDPWNNFTVVDTRDTLNFHYVYE